MKDFSSVWEGLTSDKFVLRTVSGYEIPFFRNPFQQIAPVEPKISQEDQIIVQRLIGELMNKGAISECTPAYGQFISTFFLIDKPNGDKRFILNLKNLNKNIVAPHFKMENIKAALKLLTRNCFMATLDLKDSYFLVPVAKKHKKYLRFVFKRKLYEFNCLPFGLCTAPHAFTKMMKPVVHFLRSKNLLSIIYLDDILLLGRSIQDCMFNVEETRHLLEKLGLVINFDKSQLIPSTKCKFLGFILDSQEFCLKLTDKKRQEILELAVQLRHQKCCKIRRLAEFLGKLAWACYAVRYGRLYTKALEREKFLALQRMNGDFEKSVSLSEGVISDLDWWFRKIAEVNNPINEGHYKLVIFTDASTSGWGVSCKEEKTHGWWSPDELEEHINYLELKAAFYGLKCFANKLRSCNVLLRIDNTTAIAYINRMGSV